MAVQFHGAASMVEEEERFHGLHPLKRFKILEKERVMEKREKEMGVKVCSLPAKKRVCALQFFTSLPDEEDEQENRKLPSTTKREPTSSVAVRALQPIISNCQVPVSMKPEGKAKEEKKMREASSRVVRDNLLPSLNRQVLVSVDSTQRALQRQQQQNGVNLAKGTHGQVQVTTGEGLVAEQLPNAVKLVKKQTHVGSVPLHHASHRQLSVATSGPSKIRDREVGLKLARNKKEASLALGNQHINRHVSVAEKGVCEYVAAASTGIKLLKEQSKETKTSHVVNVQPIHDCQVSVGSGQIERVVVSKPEERCSADEGEEGLDGEDDGVFCDVCKDADAEPSDPIVFCDGCNVMVHPSCYGSPLSDGIPAGDWFCRQCESENRRKKAGKSQKGSHVGFHVGQRTCASRVCCLCPSRVGAMKRTTGGAWAHLSCALYVPEVFYKQARDREGIECGSVPAWRWELPCVVCMTHGQGACFQCTEVGCSSTFHVSCALNAGLTIDFRNANALTKTPAIVIAFCPSHSRQALTSSERRRFKIVPRN